MAVVTAARENVKELAVRLQQAAMDVCFDDIRWAISIVESRAFTMSRPSNRSDPLHKKPFLAPMADLLNHHPDAKVGWSLENEEAHVDEKSAFQILSLNGYGRAGAEVFNHYAVSFYCCSLVSTSIGDRDRLTVSQSDVISKNCLYSPRRSSGTRCF